MELNEFARRKGQKYQILSTANAGLSPLILRFSMMSTKRSRISLAWTKDVNAQSSTIELEQLDSGKIYKAHFDKPSKLAQND